MIKGYESPFQVLFNLQNALDARRQSGWFEDLTGAAGSYPPINIFQKGEDYVAIIELPGIDKTKLEIEAKDNLIRLSGEKNVEISEGTSAHRRERISGKFDRTISVPIKIDADKLNAEYRDGILALQIPRAEEDKPKKITIS